MALSVRRVDPGSRRSPLLTWLATAVLIAAAVVAVNLQRGGSDQPVAAHVDASVITDASVAREVAAIKAQPVYARALHQASTLALTAPVDPRAVAAAGGDPDDLRLTFVPAGSMPQTRAYSDADLRATVLTRLLYVAALRELLRARHVTPTAAELSDGREQARLTSGEDLAGGSLFDALPGWYQRELASRGADIAALEHSLVGDGGITATDVSAAYTQRMATDFTSVCLRVAVGSPHAHSAGCAPMSVWSADVAADVRSVAVGSQAAPLTRDGRVALLTVTSRVVSPLSAVRASVTSALSARYTDVVNNVVEDQLAVGKVSVASHYGTYENQGRIHDVVPPDVFTPPSYPPGGGVHAPKQPGYSGPQRPDPFD